MKLFWFELMTQIRVFWRYPIAAIFTFAFPLMFLFLFNIIMGADTVASLADIPFPQYFTPSIAVFAVMTACYTNLAIMTSIDRDEGILKRIRGTPLSPGVYLSARAAAASAVGVTSVLAMFAAGAAFFDFEILWERVGYATGILILGSVTFSVLGLALAGAAPNGQSTPAITNATILPLAFLSGVFIPIESGWVNSLASVFPVRPFVLLFTAQWNPSVSAGVSDLAVMVAWSAVGVVVARHTFTWEPRPGGRRRSLA